MLSSNVRSLFGMYQMLCFVKHVISLTIEDFAVGLLSGINCCEVERKWVIKRLKMSKELKTSTLKYSAIQGLCLNVVLVGILQLTLLQRHFKLYKCSFIFHWLASCKEGCDWKMKLLTISDLYKLERKANTDPLKHQRMCDTIKVCLDQTYISAKTKIKLGYSEHFDTSFSIDLILWAHSPYFYQSNF